MGKIRNSLSSKSYMTDHKVVNRNSPSQQKYLQQGAVLSAQEQVNSILKQANIQHCICEYSCFGNFCNVITLLLHNLEHELTSLGGAFHSLA